jgi:hypothetical protein
MMPKRYPSPFVGFTTVASMGWLGSMPLAAASTRRASPAGGLLNDAPVQVPSAVLLTICLVVICAAFVLLLRDPSNRLRDPRTGDRLARD